MESGWLDLTATSAPGSARMTAYTYVPVDSADAQAFADQNRPRTVTEQIGGVTVAKTYYAYRIDGDGYRTQISERCADPAAAYGDPGNLRTVTTFFPATPPKRAASNQTYPRTGA
jgi:hypothetical protein